MTISIIILFAIFASLVTLCAAPSPTPSYLIQTMPSRTTHTQEAVRRRQEDKAMVAATLQKEKDAAKKDGLKAVIEKENPNTAADMSSLHEPLPMVVSPPSAPNLTSLLTGHVGQEVGTQAAANTTASDMDINTQDEKRLMTMLNLPKKRNQKKLGPQKKGNTTRE